MKINYILWLTVFIGGYFVTGCGKVHDSNAVPAQNVPAIVPTEEPTPEPEETPVPHRFEISDGEDHGGLTIYIMKDTWTGKKYMIITGQANSVTPLNQD